jgi:hypothetical protein
MFLYYLWFKRFLLSNGFIYKGNQEICTLVIMLWATFRIFDAGISCILFEIMPLPYQINAVQNAISIYCGRLKVGD